MISTVWLHIKAVYMYIIHKIRYGNETTQTDAILTQVVEFEPSDNHDKSPFDYNMH